MVSSDFKSFAKALCIMCVAAVYLILIGFFLKIEAELSLKPMCPTGWKCFRVCCGDKKTCYENYMSESYKKNLTGHNFSLDNESVTIFGPESKVVYGQPKCSLRLIEKFHIVEVSLQQ